MRSASKVGDMSKFDTIEPSVFSMIRGGPEIAGKVSSRLLARCRSTRPLHPAVDSEDEEEEAPTGTTLRLLRYVHRSFIICTIAHCPLCYPDATKEKDASISHECTRGLWMHPRPLDASTVL